MEDRPTNSHNKGVVRPLGLALLMLGISVAAFLLVPDFMARQLSVAASPAVRDTAVLAWFIACIVAASWTLLRVQRGTDRQLVRSDDIEDEN